MHKTRASRKRELNWRTAPIRGTWKRTAGINERKKWIGCATYGKIAWVFNKGNIKTLGYPIISEKSWKGSCWKMVMPKKISWRMQERKIRYSEQDIARKGRYCKAATLMGCLWKINPKNLNIQIKKQSFWIMAQKPLRNFIYTKKQKIINWMDASCLKIDKLRSKLAPCFDNWWNFKNIKGRNNLPKNYQINSYQTYSIIGRQV